MLKNTEKSMALLEETLLKLISPECAEYSQLADAMKYSVECGGKRIRPQLCMAFCELCGGNAEDALYPACAVEYIHTYSLIHDDLPCMDNDDMRRGKPSNHKVYGEDIALLAGDALLTLAFETILSFECFDAIGIDCAAICAKYLSNLSGLNGMVGGQVVDLALEKTAGDMDTVVLMQTLKTSNLIRAACMMGCVCAGASPELTTAAGEFGARLGLQFQIIDDILDVTSTTEVLGKPVNSDAENNKTNMVSLLGIDLCRAFAEDLTVDAIEYLNDFSGDSSKLADFAKELLHRIK